MTGPVSSVRSAGFAMFVGGYAVAFALSNHAYGSLAVPSPFWLPDSVLLVALLLSPRTRWWMFLIAIWPTRLIIGAPAGTPLWFLLVTTANDALKGFGAAWLLGKVLRRSVLL